MTDKEFNLKLFPKFDSNRTIRKRMNSEGEKKVEWILSQRAFVVYQQLSKKDKNSFISYE